MNRDNSGRFKKGHKQLNTGKTHFKKGYKHSKKWFDTMKKKMLGNTNGFKKGMIPWNKGLKGYLSKEKNPMWKGGITPFRDRVRKGIEYKEWRRACLKRNNFTCQITGQKGGDLVVHHINNFAEFPELRFAIDNGITLSKEVHSKFHKIYGFKNNTMEQLQEFAMNYYGVLSANFS